MFCCCFSSFLTVVTWTEVISECIEPNFINFFRIGRHSGAVVMRSLKERSYGNQSLKEIKEKSKKPAAEHTAGTSGGLK